MTDLDRDALARAGAKVRLAEVRALIRALKDEETKLLVVIGGCRKSVHCWQTDDHDGGCSDIRLG